MDGGVRRKYIYFDERNWDLLQLDTSVSQEEMRSLISDMLGKQFDVLGLVGFVFRRAKHSKKKLFCSEFVMTCLGYQDAWRFDPNTAYAALLKYRS
jgi:hypothetical protein